MKKKDIFIYVILTILFFSCVLLVIQIININEKYDKLQIAMTENSNNVQVEDYKSNYSSEIETLKNEINTLKKNNIFKQYDDTISLIKEDVKSLKNKYNSIPDHSKDISTLEKKINSLNDNYLSLQQTNNKIVGKWKTTITITEFSVDDHTTKDVTYTTLYEFKSNGDFYINNNKVGTFSDNDVLLKDLNDEQYRAGHYYYVDDNLYLNFYATSKNITISTDFYKCEKN